MPLLALWVSNPEAVSRLSVEQVVATAVMENYATTANARTSFDSIFLKLALNALENLLSIA